VVVSEADLTIAAVVEVEAAVVVTADKPTSLPDPETGPVLW